MVQLKEFGFDIYNSVHILDSSDDKFGSPLKSPFEAPKSDLSEKGKQMGDYNMASFRHFLEIYCEAFSLFLGL